MPRGSSRASRSSPSRPRARSSPTRPSTTSPARSTARSSCPQVITAITAALLGAGLGGRFGTKRIYLVGSHRRSRLDGAPPRELLPDGRPGGSRTDCCSSPPPASAPASASPCRLSTRSPRRSTRRGRPLDPRAQRTTRAGNGAGPVFVAIFDGLGFWWGLPLTVAVLLAVLIVVSLRLPLRVAVTRATKASARLAIPRRYWVYACFAVLYGICETVNGNWSQLDMTSELGASTTQAALALTAFWAMVTVGRVFFAAVQRVFPPRLTYHVLPFVLAGAFVLIWLLPEDEPALGRPRVRPRRVRVLGAPAADDQLRPGGAHAPSRLRSPVG